MAQRSKRRRNIEPLTVAAAAIGGLVLGAWTYIGVKLAKDKKAT